MAGGNAKQRKQAIKRVNKQIELLPTLVRDRLLEQQEWEARKKAEERALAEVWKEAKISIGQERLDMEREATAEAARIVKEANVKAGYEYNRISERSKILDRREELIKAGEASLLAERQHFLTTSKALESANLVKEILMMLELDEEPNIIADEIRKRFNILIPKW